MNNTKKNQKILDLKFQGVQEIQAYAREVLPTVILCIPEEQWSLRAFYSLTKDVVYVFTESLRFYMKSSLLENIFSGFSLKKTCL